MTIARLFHSCETEMRLWLRNGVVPIDQPMFASRREAARDACTMRCCLLQGARGHLAEVLRYPGGDAIQSSDGRSKTLTGRLRSAHVIAGLDPVHGGPAYSVPRLCEALAAAGAETMLLS